MFDSTAEVVLGAFMAGLLVVLFVSVVGLVAALTKPGRERG